MGVFVSYSSRDADAINSLTQGLQDADEQVWLDQRLGGGDEWWCAILEQIRGCEVFIFALSQNSIRSKPCQAELHYAQALGLPILPVRIGPVDSMQLNPLATVQSLDYRTPTPKAAIQLVAALHRKRAQRQPLPSPLPDEPPVPFEYLMRLHATIAGPDYLSPRDQAGLVAQLHVGLREDGEHEGARNDMVMLLTKLHDREDATHRTRTDVEAILASLDAEAQLEPASQPSGTTATSTHPVSTGSTSTLGARPTGPEDIATTDTAETRVEVPSPPNTTAAETITVSTRKGEHQPDPKSEQERPLSLWQRGTKIGTVLVLIGLPLVYVMYTHAQMPEDQTTKIRFYILFFVGIICLVVGGRMISLGVLKAKSIRRGSVRHD